MRKRDRRQLVKEKQKQRGRTPEEQSSLNKILSDLRRLRDEAVTHNSKEITREINQTGMAAS
jgi:hypothetical protein